MIHSRTSALALRCAPLPLVRIGFVGLGRRGLATLRRYQYIGGVQVTALADLSETCVASAKSVLQGWHKYEEVGDPSESWAHYSAEKLQCYVGKDAASRLIHSGEVDVVYLCTDWASHTPLAVEAMRAGKHVAVEVPAATSVEECWMLVRTAEETQRHCFMTENCCYDWFSLATRSLYNSGFFGTLTHAEGGYLHDWRMFFADAQTQSYEQGAFQGGNPYPTHGIAPIGQLLRDNDDRMVRLVSMTGRAMGHESSLGHANSTLITTEKGVTILLQFDCTTPRPYSRLQTLCGTKAFAQKYPNVTLQTDDGVWTKEEAVAQLWSASLTPQMKLWQEGKARGLENPMNYAMDARFIGCLQAGLPLDIDVYDVAEWSCLVELTRVSAEQGGMPVEIPRFRP